MSKTWFTSDLHIGHVNILQYEASRRTYLGLSETDDVHAMNRAIVDLWNAQVAPDDTVYVIGDTCMGKVHETIQYVAQLHGTKHLCLGNHDRPHAVATRDSAKRQAWFDEYRAAGFQDMFYMRDMNFDGIDAHVCHFPYFGDHTEERYNAEQIGEFVPFNDGMPLVHGHVHGAWKTNQHMFNVGIDAHDGVFQDAEAIGAYFRSIGFTA